MHRNYLQISFYQQLLRFKKKSKCVSKLSDIMAINVCHNHNLRSFYGARRGEQFQEKKITDTLVKDPGGRVENRSKSYIQRYLGK
jgi:hypothetical protein